MWYAHWVASHALHRVGAAGSAGASNTWMRALLLGAIETREAQFALPYWKVTDPRAIPAVERLLGYQARFHLCGNAAARRECPELLGGGETDCHCLPTEADVAALVERPCFGPLDDPACFFSGLNKLHLAAHHQGTHDAAAASRSAYGQLPRPRRERRLWWQPLAGQEAPGGHGGERPERP